MKFKLPRWVGAVVLISVPLILFVWYAHLVGNYVSIPHSVKLIDCTNGTATFHLKVPKGHGFRLDLNTQDAPFVSNSAATPFYVFSGRIRISTGGSLLADLIVGSNDLWAAKSGYALTGTDTHDTNRPVLSKFIEPQKDYNVEITLTPEPPPSSSIWLYWLESRYDLKK